MVPVSLGPLCPSAGRTGCAAQQGLGRLCLLSSGYVVMKPFGPNQLQIQKDAHVPRLASGPSHQFESSQEPQVLSTFLWVSFLW